jgi:hypothetical protein
VVPSSIHPLHSAYRNYERASRCLRLPVMWIVSSLRYSSISTFVPQADGSGYRSKWVSALRRAQNLEGLDQLDRVVRPVTRAAADRDLGPVVQRNEAAG